MRFPNRAPEADPGHSRDPTTGPDADHGPADGASNDPTDNRAADHGPPDGSAHDEAAVHHDGAVAGHDRSADDGPADDDSAHGPAGHGTARPAGESDRPTVDNDHHRQRQHRGYPTLSAGACWQPDQRQ